MARLRSLVPWLAWLAAAALVLVAVREVSFADAWRALQTLRATEITALVALNALVLWMMNLRTWLILRSLGHRVSPLRLFGMRLAGFGVSYFTPGMQFGGEPVQVLWLKRREGVPSATAAAAVTLDKSIELMVSFSFLVGALTLIVPGRLGHTFTANLLPVTGGLLLLPGLYLAAVWAGRRPATALWGRSPALAQQRWPYFGRALASVEEQVGETCRREPLKLALATIASVAGFASMIVEFGAMLRFLGLDAGMSDILTAFAFARIGLLAPTPGGLGGVEASQVLAFGALGYNASIAISLLLLIRARDLLLGLAGLALAGQILGKGHRRL